MKYALIGCGRIAINHIKAAKNNNVDIVALCDIVLSKIDALIERSGYDSLSNVRKYADYKEMLMENPDLDLIAIATESGEHASIALDCIDAEKNLIIEKPIALSMADANEIIRRSAEKGVKVSACHQNRFNIAIRKLRDAMEAGRFGNLSHGSIHVRWNRNRNYYSQAPWRGTWAQDGGCLMNQCIHGIDLLRWMMGDDVVEVYGATRQRMHDYLEAEDVGVATVKFSNGALGVIEGTTNVFPENLEETLCIFGSEGTAKIGGTSTNNIDVWDFSDMSDNDFESKGLKEQTSNVYGNGHTALYRDVIDAIENDREPYVDAIAGRNALEMVLAIYKSQRTGLPVALPLDEFSAVEMEGEFQNG